MSPLRKQKKGSKSPNLPAQFQVISPVEVPFVPVILPRMELSNEATHFVYLLLCANGSIYVGQTRDLSARLVRHSSGSGARHTAGIKPVELIYKEGPMAFSKALAREKQIKKWSRAKKLALAEGNLELSRKLSRASAPLA